MVTRAQDKSTAYGSLTRYINNVEVDYMLLGTEGEYEDQLKRAEIWSQQSDDRGYVGERFILGRETSHE